MSESRWVALRDRVVPVSLVAMPDHAGMGTVERVQIVETGEILPFGVRVYQTEIEAVEACMRENRVARKALYRQSQDALRLSIDAEMVEEAMRKRLIVLSETVAEVTS